MKSLLIILIFLSSLGLNVIAPNLKEISQQYNLAELEGYFTFGGLNYLLIYIPISISSILLFFYKRKIPFSPYAIALSIGICELCLPLSSHLYIFILFTICIGISYGLLLPSIYSHIKGMTSANKEMEAVGLINISIGLAVAIGQYFSGFMGHIFQEMGWKITYFTIGSMTILFSIGMLIWKPMPKEKLSSNKQANIFHKNKYYYILLLVQYIPGSIPWGALTVFIFPFLETNLVYSKLAAVNLVTIFGVGMIFGTMVASQLGDRWKQKRENTLFLLLISSFILSEVVVISLLYFFPSLNFWIASISLFLSGMILAFPGTYIKGILFSDLDEFETQRIFSIENFLESLGKGLGPFITAFILLLIKDLFSSMVLSILFWNFSILLIVLAYFFRPRKVLDSGREM